PPSEALALAIQQGDVAELQRMWPEIVTTQHAQFVQVWRQLPLDTQRRHLAHFSRQFSPAQQAELAQMLESSKPASPVTGDAVLADGAKVQAPAATDIYQTAILALIPPSEALALAIQQGDVAELQRLWPEIVTTQREQFLQVWQQLPLDTQRRHLAHFSRQFSLAQQAELAQMLESSKPASPVTGDAVLADGAKVQAPAATDIYQTAILALIPPSEALALAIQQGDVAGLQRMWPEIVTAQRAQFLQAWQQLPRELQRSRFVLLNKQLAAEQQAELAGMLHFAGLAPQGPGDHRPSDAMADDAQGRSPETWRENFNPAEVLQPAGLAGDGAAAMASPLGQPSPRGPLAPPQAGQTAPPQDPGPASIATAPVKDLPDGLASTAMIGAAPTSLAMEPSLANFRDWVRHTVDLAQLQLTLPELRQWLNWWLMQDAKLLNQDCSLMLDAIDLYCGQAADRVQFMKLVLTDLRAGNALDLEARAGQSGQAAMEAERPFAMDAISTLTSHDALRDFIRQHRHEDEQLRNLNSTQLHQLLRAWLLAQQADGAFPLILAAVEKHALQAPSAHAFFRQVLQHLLDGSVLDFDLMTKQAGPQAQALLQWQGGGAPAGQHAAVSAAAPDTPVPPPVSPLPLLLQQNLSQRLADAMLQGDLTPLHGIWSEIARFHADVLAEAARRYLRRADVRDKLIARADAGMLRILLHAISVPVAQFVDLVWPHAAQCNAVLANPLPAQAFEQRLLRFAFTQALEAVAVDWMAALFQALAGAQIGPAQYLTSAHAWRQILPAHQAFDQALLGRTYMAALGQDLPRFADGSVAPALRAMLISELCGHYPALAAELLSEVDLQQADPAIFSVQEWQALRQAGRAVPDPGAWRGHATGPAQRQAHGTVSEAMLSILLLRTEPPGPTESACMGLLLQRLLDTLGDAHASVSGVSGALESALSQPAAIDRLVAVLPGPVLARLLVQLQPQLAAQLPSLLRAIADAVAIPNVPAMQDEHIWRAIYQSAFIAADPVAPAEFMRAFVHRVTGREDAPLLSITFTGTREELVNTLFQPLAAPVQPGQPDQPGQPFAPLHLPEEAPAWSGEANVRNAGMVIIATYMQRLFGMLDITVDGRFASEEAVQRAVHLLQYAITGEQQTPEYQLTLNKLFCGIHGGLPIVSGIRITQQEQDTIEQMLQAVIAHWGALGNTSIAGLRETFLQREGQLYFQDDAWHLKIPQRPFDMLLDRLPWSFSMIRFPWMAYPLHVSWR
ncbi:contractile injection system tape measure protein, partial [Janthinobacterium sp. Mn2066]|uniref:contractile injection system tape measure protein n=1 Tax=Janthinobacterium sp. Mn2066 TaxID=3395264 RepID=UPI003BDF76E6